MLMIQNNLDPAVAQHPEELITYGGNGAVFQNWAQYRLVMRYLSEMTEEQTLVMYSGHPMGLFPLHPGAPRVVVTNGMVIPNYSSGDDYERMNALGVSQYGQMTAGSYMYIGPQGIVHGTTITVLNAGRRLDPENPSLAGKLFVTAGLGGMSGAQPKAGNIAGVVSVTAEVDPTAAWKRHEQGWVDHVVEDVAELADKVRDAMDAKDVVSFAYLGNVVDVGNTSMRPASTSTSALTRPPCTPLGRRILPGGPHLRRIADHDGGGSRPVQGPRPGKLAPPRRGRQPPHRARHLLLRLRQRLPAGELPRRSRHHGRGRRNLPLPQLRAGHHGPDVFRLRFRAVPLGLRQRGCHRPRHHGRHRLRGARADDDRVACGDPPANGRQHPMDSGGKANKLVVGSQARILYADAEGRMRIAKAFNDAIASGRLSGPVILGRDHHDVSGTDSPYRETSNIYDGSAFTADMAVQNFVGDAFRGATWVSLHNGGGVGWGEVMNGGFGMLLDGSAEAEQKLTSMLHWDVNNGIARRSWARNEEAQFAIRRAMDADSRLKVTLAQSADPDLIRRALS